MNIVNKLTLRHIISHKRRSLLTVLAIIVSVAMVTAVFTSIFSFIKFMQNSILAYDGNWHAQLFYSEMPDMTAFESSDLDYYVGANLFRFTYDKDAQTAKAHAAVDAVDENAVKIRNINISDGKFPAKHNEIVVTKEYIEKNKLDWKVGDTVSLYCLDLNNEPYGYKNYTLCGIADGNVSFFDNRDAFVANLNGAIPKDLPVYVTVEYHTLDNAVFDKTEALLNSTNATKSIMNNNLLRYSGIVKDTDSLKAVCGFTAVILTVIVIASIIMLYDSFAVSYQERERYLGMLASVGATKRQKRAGIYFEGFILGMIGIVIGITAGFVGMTITFKSIKNAFLATVSLPIKDTLKVHFSPYIILATIVISAITIFISCYIPARRASKTTPIAAIKGTNTVKVKKAKKLRVSKLAGKIYGYEGELAVKNFKRNGRRSKNIVFALVMSVVLFLTVTNFSKMFTSLVKQEAGEGSADFIFYTEISGREKAEKYFDGANIDGYIGYTGKNVSINNPELFTEDAKRVLGLSNSDEPINFYFFFMDNASFDDYLRSIGENPESYHDSKKVKAVVFNRLIDHTTGRTPDKRKAFLDETKGKELNCFSLDYNENTGKYDIKKPFTVTAGTLTDREYDSPLFQPKYVHYPSLILSEDAIASLPLEYNEFNFGIFAKDYKAAMRTADEYFENADVSYEVVDSTSQMKAINAFLQITNVFTYGFITLLTFIAIINIVNSISTSMNERKTEFAMLKSVGVSPKGFKKMIYVESTRYGIKSLMWSFPISIGLHVLMYQALTNAESMQIPFASNWQYYLAAVIAVFIIILASLLYSADKIKDDNIIENLKQD